MAFTRFALSVAMGGFPCDGCRLVGARSRAPGVGSAVCSSEQPMQSFTFQTAVGGL